MVVHNAAEYARFDRILEESKRRTSRGSVKSNARTFTVRVLFDFDASTETDLPGHGLRLVDVSMGGEGGVCALVPHIL